MDGSTQENIRIPADDVRLTGDLNVPTRAAGLVVFAHGSGSSRSSRRNRHVARQLNRAGLATLLFDLLTEDEERIDRVTRELRFDIPLLARRLTHVIDWLDAQRSLAPLPVGLFGASTGAAAALIAAAQRPARVVAVVSRGGRPDLAGRSLEEVAAPTLLIVGSLDAPVIALNQEAAARLSRAVHTLEIVEGASHLFEEPGTLDEVADLAAEWFRRHMQGARLDANRGMHPG